MDILISANEPILRLMRNIPQELRDGMDGEALMEWFEQMDKGNGHGECVQEVTV